MNNDCSGINLNKEYLVNDLRIILASSSPRRKALLEQLKLRFEIVPSRDEKILEMEDKHKQMPDEKKKRRFKDKERWFAEKRALLKANDVESIISEDAIVLAADTIVLQGNRILGKPVDESEAFDMLSSLSGRIHHVITGVAIIDSKYKKQYIDSEITEVKIRYLKKTEILSYIKSGEPMDKAGAYGIQGLGAMLVQRINGCYFNVVGLPLFLMQKMLHKIGKKIL